jgi:hypothetical protein
MLELLAGITLGLHVATVHLPQADYLHNTNPGVYARLDNGITFGAYRNSFGRTSAYLAYTYEYGFAALTVGGITGYQMKDVPCVGDRARMGYDYCYDGNSRGAVGLLIAPSVRLPEVLGITPRITLLPQFSAKGHTAIHLSIERGF